MKKKILIITIAVIVLVLSIYILYFFNIIPHKKYNNKDFNIDTYTSKIDKDNDGVDDQSDILNSAKEYIKTKPIYKSKYYGSGYSDDEYGVCTDVVAFALLGAGYDIKELLNDDVSNNRDLYDIKNRDKNIDFRRVNNLNVYFNNNAIKLTNDLKKIEEWQGGDIVVFKKHIAIVSDNRNYKGIPFIIHLAPNQRDYEEDKINAWGEIVGHFRIS